MVVSSFLAEALFQMALTCQALSGQNVDTLVLVWLAVLDYLASYRAVIFFLPALSSPRWACYITQESVEGSVSKEWGEVLPFGFMYSSWMLHINVCLTLYQIIPVLLLQILWWKGWTQEWDGVWRSFQVWNLSASRFLGSSWWQSDYSWH